MSTWPRLQAERVGIAKARIDYQRRVGDAAPAVAERRRAENAAAEQGIEFRVRIYRRRTKSEPNSREADRRGGSRRSVGRRGRGVSALAGSARPSSPED